MKVAVFAALTIFLACTAHAALPPESDNIDQDTQTEEKVVKDKDELHTAERDGLGHVGCMAACEVYPYGGEARRTCVDRCKRIYGF